VLNSLLNFIGINTPIAKANTLSVILEDILEAIEKQLRAKDIRIARRCEKDLPETFLHSEQVRFVLHSIVQYAVFLTPAHESIRILMKSPDIAECPDTRKALPENKGYVEVMIGFNGGRKPGVPSKNLKDVPGDPREAIDLILVLAREILQKNHGMMTMETNGSRPKTLITVRFPIERRKVVYYAPITL
jgi:nitrogen-specific signal transduction histidine kinase